MPSLALFITLATLLAVMLALIVLLPWLRADKSARSNRLITLNVEVFEERLNELQSDYQQGRMDEVSFKNQKTELERQLLQATDDSDASPTAREPQSAQLAFTQSKKARLTIMLCIPLLMGLGYALSQDRTPVMTLWQTQDSVGQVADDLMTGKIEVPPQWASKDSVALINAIQTNVHHHAYDAMRWVRLADIYLMLEANQQALEALARAYRLEPADDSIAVRYAQTQFFVNNGSLNQDGFAALQGVLTRNPNHQSAMMFMAMGEARVGNYESAQGWLDKLRLDISQRDGDHTEALQSLDKLSARITEQSKGTANRDSMGVNVSVKLSPTLLPLIQPDDTLFVTVVESTGGAPYAVRRMSVSDLIGAQAQSGTQSDFAQSMELTLSDSDAMMPSRTLSSAMTEGKSLIVNARISKSGQAMTESGDLAATPIPLNYDNLNNEGSDPPTDVVIEINQQVP